ncbi:Transcription elongation factor GreA [hydrothermal vent metagenome]|uniref:Transcription elongation factor GreA n=1 Tax=hydrothermal vent metagenome TaxID=652676 RepID=A0A1W1BDF6_9ZZZZ
MNKEPISKEGYDLLIEEFKFLKEVHKPEVAKEKQIAAAHGDRSENAEYHAAKEKLRLIDKRLFFLNSMIERSVIIDPSTLDHSRVCFGSRVHLLDLDSDKEEVYTICGSLEAEVENGLISIHSPLAKALIGKKEGDEVVVHLPKGKKEYEIEKIEYIPIFDLKKKIPTKEDFRFH